MASIQEKLIQAVNQNEIKKCLHLFTVGAKLTPDVISAIKNGHEELKIVLQPLINAKNEVSYTNGRRINSLNQQELDNQLSMAVEDGRQKGAISLMVHGARLSLESVKLMQQEAFQAQHNKTFQALQPYVRCFFAKGNYTSGHGNFTAMTGYRKVSSSQIGNIEKNSERNKVLKTALTLTKALDKANKKDIKTLSLFLKQLDNPVSVSKIIEALKHDKEKLSQLKSRFPNLKTVNLEAEKLLNNYKVIDEAINWLQTNPQLSQGYLHKYLDQYTSLQLSYLKTVFLYASVLNKIDESALQQLQSFYQLKLPEAYNRELRCIPSDTFYLPTAGYVLYGDQCRSDKKNTRVALTDCSGFITNVMRELQPENTWLKDNRFRSWDLEKGHDVKMQRRPIPDTKKGPLNSANKRRALNSEEKQRIDSWLQSRENSECSKTIDTCFDTVKDSKNIRPGDFIVYRQRLNNNSLSSETGHVAMVADYDKETNKAVLLEYTRSTPYAGLGFTNRPICYQSSERIKWESRILRPKFNQESDECAAASSCSSSSVRL